MSCRPTLLAGAACSVLLLSSFFESEAGIEPAPANVAAQDRALSELVTRYGCGKLKAWALAHPDEMFRHWLREVVGAGYEDHLIDVVGLKEALKIIQGLEEAIYGEKWKTVQIYGDLLFNIAVKLGAGPIGAAVWSVAKQLNGFADALTEEIVGINVNTYASMMEKDPRLRAPDRVDFFLDHYLHAGSTTPESIRDFDIMRRRNSLTDYAKKRLGQKDFPYFRQWPAQIQRVRAAAASMLDEVEQVYRARERAKLVPTVLIELEAKLKEKIEINESFQRFRKKVLALSCYDNWDQGPCTEEVKRIEEGMQAATQAMGKLRAVDAASITRTSDELAAITASYDFDAALIEAHEACRDLIQSLDSLAQQHEQLIGDVDLAKERHLAAAEHARAACETSDPSAAEAAAEAALLAAESGFRVESALRTLREGLAQVPRDVPRDAWLAWREQAEDALARAEELTREVATFEETAGGLNELLEALEDRLDDVARRCGEQAAFLDKAAPQTLLAELRSMIETLHGFAARFDLGDHTLLEERRSTLSDVLLRGETLFQELTACMEGSPDLTDWLRELERLEVEATAGREEAIEHAARARLCASTIGDASVQGTWVLADVRTEEKPIPDSQKRRPNGAVASWSSSESELSYEWYQKEGDLSKSHTQFTYSISGEIPTHLDPGQSFTLDIQGEYALQHDGSPSSGLDIHVKGGLGVSAKDGGRTRMVMTKRTQLPYKRSFVFTAPGNSSPREFSLQLVAHSGSFANVRWIYRKP